MFHWRQRHKPLDRPNKLQRDNDSYFTGISKNAYILHMLGNLWSKFLRLEVLSGLNWRLMISKKQERPALGLTLTHSPRLMIDLAVAGVLTTHYLGQQLVFQSNSSWHRGRQTLVLATNVEGIATCDWLISCQLTEYWVVIGWLIVSWLNSELWLVNITCE